MLCTTFRTPSQGCRNNFPIGRWKTSDYTATDNLIAKAASELGIRHTTTSPYHAQANPVERVNRVLKTMIASFVDNDHRSWDKHLPDFCFAYNTGFHSSTHVSPAFLNFGREPKCAESLKVKEEGTLLITPLAAQDWEDRVKRHEPIDQRHRYPLVPTTKRSSQPQPAELLAEKGQASKSEIRSPRRHTPSPA